MHREVRVRGTGVAALVCAGVLAQRGFRIRLAGCRPSARPPVVLEATTVALLDDLFGGLPALWARAWPLRRRHVRWGPDGKPDTVAAPALALRGEQLVEGLFAALVERHGARLALDDGSGDAGRVYTVTASRSSTPPGHRLGLRRMLVSEWNAAPGADLATTRIETTPGGWVFMAPIGPGAAMVQAMVPAPPADPGRCLDALLGDTRDIGRHVRGARGAVRVFEAAPALASTLARPGWIATGGAAFRLDPVCGDGTGDAARTAILAASVVDAVARGLPEPMCLEHYRARLRVALAGHLRACLRFYDAGGFEPAWDRERAASLHGLDRLARARARGHGFTFRLNGFTLVPVGSERPSLATR